VKLRRTLVALGLALVAAATQAQPALSGRWVSETVEDDGSHFATRSFSFGAGSWRLVYRAYADRDGRQPLFQLDVGGIYVIGQPSAVVPGAHEAVFPVDHRHLRADSEAGVQLFAAMGCTLQQGREAALVAQGCGFVPGVMQVMGEYDLVALQGDRLFLGDRAGDLSKTRPSKLTPHALRRP
jgi:hypothetical protein